MEAQSAGGTSPFARKFMKLAANRQWQGLAAIAFILSAGGPTPLPSDFRAVGRMSARLQNAYCLLSLMDPGRDESATFWLRSAWDKMADAIEDISARAGEVLNPANW
jgi:hypothetical protein